jgi:mRNA degradation ribonuclease J1/J2
MRVFETEGSCVVLDAGLAFPRDEHLGVDLILPDFGYLRDRASSVRAIVLTHAHEDHLGGASVPAARGDGAGGLEELFKLPSRNRAVDLTTGLWGIWMPGFMQFLTGVYLWVGLAWTHSFREKPLYMAALAFTAYGVQLVGDRDGARSAATRARTASCRSPSP